MSISGKRYNVVTVYNAVYDTNMRVFDLAFDKGDWFLLLEFPSKSKNQYAKILFKGEVLLARIYKQEWTPLSKRWMKKQKNEQNQ